MKSRSIRWQFFLSALLLAVLLVIPELGLSPNALRLLFISFVWITASLAWNLLGGYAGQVSFGFAVFNGIGAYTAAMLINNGRVHPYLAFLAAGVAAALASVL